MTSERDSTGEIKGYSNAGNRHEQLLEDFVSIASAICRTPAAFILVYEEGIPRILSSTGLEQDELSLITKLAAASLDTAQPGITQSSLSEEQGAEASEPESRIRFYAAVPIIEEEKTLGLIGVADRSNRPNLSPEETQALLSLSRQFTNRLSREEEEARRKVMQSVVAAHEEERKRIARELHDQLSQQLISMNLGLEALKGQSALPEQARRQVEDLQHILDALAEEVARIEHNLHPAALEGATLHEALLDYVEQWAEETGIHLTTDISATEEELPLAVKTCLFRVTQESLTNIYKHAQASEVSIILRSRKAELILIIEDNGIGLNLDESHDMVGTGLGLRSMRERVELLGGTLEIESAKGEGTCVCARLPVSVDEEEAVDGKAEDFTGG
jgi:signal transduction histidine kinase